MRLVVYTDYVYRRSGEVVYGERAFALFLAELAGHSEQLTIVGRLAPQPGVSHYPLPPGVEFVGLPHYADLTRPLTVLGSLIRSLHRFWRVLRDVDRVWLLGPYPHAVAFALLTLVRRRRLVLGVRQDFPAYVRSRRPGRRWAHRAADLLELCWVTLARRCPVIVVGPELERHYQHSPRVLSIAVSLISAEDVGAGEQASKRSYAGELRLLSVGRLDREKNPLLLADVLARLRKQDARWRLLVCGDGPLAEDLVRRLSELGLSDDAELLGYVPIQAGLLDLYRSSHVFLHVSWTEGMPQVLMEAFASGVPVAATAVGGVAGAVGEAGLLIPPGDAAAAASAVHRIATETGLRLQLMRAGLQRARDHTLETEAQRVADFIRA